MLLLPQTGPADSQGLLLSYYAMLEQTTSYITSIYISTHLHTVIDTQHDSKDEDANKNMQLHCNEYLQLILCSAFTIYNSAF